MEKCEFCSRKVLFGKKDMSNLLCARPVVLAKGDPVKRFAHTVKHGIKLTAARGLLLFPFREKELVY